MQTPRPQLDVTLPPRPFLPPLTTVVPKPYTPTSAIVPAFNVGLTSAGVGLFISAIKNSLEPHNKGAMGVFTRTGWLIGYFATAGFVFSFVDHTVSNLHENSSDGLAGASAGCAAGFVSGIRSGSLPKAMGLCAFLGTTIATYDMAGKQLGWESGRKNRKERELERLSFFKQKSIPEDA